ncbi:F0F1 ATP synthase subunit C [Rickettsiales endosymbiont of Stachyamoeba lipophora]|uniref:F0F1 ATP synthase subunit C n=1 Tax=Rickettsiales endosymbiont of Stachyamoeba lipophora TaxID=2486578 RepID=UPI000F656030|nr:F0F1 ATP synthase subunit C [Rickettsiales endosymbiont of Stachyamoeba lipophora]AZL15746.1 F0F1 ATP synthase subunit C [Rickettsiales endosymbiont of Stachyamoeba lipophora]
MDAQSMKYIAIGLMAIGMFGAAMGVGNIFTALLNAIARNPAVEAKMSGRALLGAAMVEAMGIFALVVAFILIYS